jgi:glycosyltransferase involved in cell wall biosynthesis
MKISVLVVTYNHENFIGKCLDSILNQVHSYPIEIIIGEDHSTDRTFEICELYQQKFPETIQLISNVKNIGLIQNQLNLIKIASGDYLAFCEGDDFWTDRLKLKKQIDFLDNNVDYGLVYTDYDVLYKNKITHKYKQNVNKLTFEGDILTESIYTLIPMTLTICFRRSILDNLFFKYMDDLYFKTFDFPMCLWLSNKAKIKFIPDSTAVFRVHSESITNSFNPEQGFAFAMSHIYMRKKFISLYPEHRILLEKMYPVIAKEVLYIAFVFKYNNKYGILAYKFLKKHFPVSLPEIIIFNYLNGNLGYNCCKILLKLIKLIKRINKRVTLKTESHIEFLTHYSTRKWL